MKIWIYKDYPENWQQFPEPTDKSQYYEVEVDSIETLESSTFVISTDGTGKLVTKAPNTYSTYNFTTNTWEDDPEKKQAYLEELLEDYSNKLLEQPSLVLAKRFPEYKDVEYLIPKARDWAAKKFANPIPLAFRIKAKSVDKEPQAYAEWLLELNAQKQALSTELDEYSIELYNNLSVEDLTLERFKELTTEADKYFADKSSEPEKQKTKQPEQ